MYLIRLDDACEYRDKDKWNKITEILIKYDIKPIFGIIPNCQDIDLMKYPKDERFWDTVDEWIALGWTPAMHGYQHVFKTNNGGINPINNYSEFAGVPYREQCEQIETGMKLLKEHDIDAKIFFAPAHTFDNNTLGALKEKTDIRIISDTIANNVYYRKGFYFIPQQAGAVRKLPFRVTTFCYHPNIMEQTDFEKLEQFISNYSKEFLSFSEVGLIRKKKTFYDNILQKLYVLKHVHKFVIKR